MGWVEASFHYCVTDIDYTCTILYEVRWDLENSVLLSKKKNPVAGSPQGTNIGCFSFYSFSAVASVWKFFFLLTIDASY